MTRSLRSHRCLSLEVALSFPLMTALLLFFSPRISHRRIMARTSPRTSPFFFSILFSLFSFPLNICSVLNQSIPYVSSDKESEKEPVGADDDKAKKKADRFVAEADQSKKKKEKSAQDAPFKPDETSVKWKDLGGKKVVHSSAFIHSMHKVSIYTHIYRYRHTHMYIDITWNIHRCLHHLPISLSLLILGYRWRKFPFTQVHRCIRIKFKYHFCTVKKKNVA